MEANEVAVGQNPHRGNPRPEFVPKLRPRRRQRGALPRVDEQQQGDSVPCVAKVPPTSEVRVIRNIRTEQSSSSQQNCFPDSPLDQDQRSPPMDVPRQEYPASYLSMEQPSLQNGLLPRPKGIIAERQNTSHRQRDYGRGVTNFSRSWHRVSMQEQPYQRIAITTADGHLYRPMRGAVFGPHGQSLQAPSRPHMGPPLSQGLSCGPPLIAPEPRTSYSFLETKTSFEGLWHQLEAAIETRDGILINMKAEIEKAFLQEKSAKADAVKEKEEVEARNAEATERLESMKKQAARIKGVRESLEQFSTDLSVQVAELNLLLQQVQERQRTLELLTSLKEHYDVSEMEKRKIMDKSLQECEVRIATMEKELESSKRTLERLEKGALDKVGDLDEIQASCTLPEVQTFTDRFQTSRKKATVARPFVQNKGQELLGHGAVVKLPKVEPMS